ncbi:MAG: Asp-tRNA(Asn)/Glu-tRNA(Gln) amidotransferase subunit GatB [bacterium]|nr:Asp-tRNA(Asn)/Glu-tRNA(Gln) amidotransferase subunit GatB [bacterium]
MNADRHRLNKIECQVTIGMEVHAQLLTQTKLFCGCPIDWKSPPNTLTCPVCLGMPGTLPVVNKRAVELAIRAALALNCKIEKISIFARKNYFYPDLPKGYQITQYEHPLATDGFLKINSSTGSFGKKVRIRRIHLEEDAGKLLHEANKTLIDFNRCGVPLIEIVTEPDITSPEEAREYLTILRQILKYTGVCTGDMEKGHLRCEPNISINPAPFGRCRVNHGVRTEIKNLNSFKAVEDGVRYEISRQIKILESGNKVEHVTLLWDEKYKKTQEMRGKEEAEDYRYFPEPDLPPLVISKEWIKEIKNTLPELPAAKIKRFIEIYKIREYDAKILCEEPRLADYYESLLKLCPDIKLVTSFMTGEFIELLHEKKLTIEEFTLTPYYLSKLFDLIRDGTISRNIARDVFPEMVETGKSATELVEKRGLKQISGKDELKKVIKEVLIEHPAEVERYKCGKTQLISFFVGQVMKKTQNRANPKLVNEILTRLLR